MSVSKLELTVSDYGSPPSPSSPTSPTLHKLDNKQSVRPYKTNDEYLYAMKEDLAAWFNDLYTTSLTAENLLEHLQDGSFLCHHANSVKEFIESAENRSDIPNITYRCSVRPGSFQARDNVANFISWVKSYLHVNDVLLFESDDLVLHKNEKNVVLCLLEVARRGARYGMPAPMLIQFEQEIDALERKIKRAEDRRNSQGNTTSDTTASCSDTDSDRASLDEWVQRAVKKCTCPKQFPLINVSQGKYRIGDTQNVVFVRVLRKHVMIRVGGGWDTLEHYLDKHDPCRCKKSHQEGAATGSNFRAGGKTRHKSSPKKDVSASSTRESSPASSHSRSTSLNNVSVSSTHSTPIKQNRKGSTDLLNSDLVVTRDGSGRHLVEDTVKHSTPVRKPSTANRQSTKLQNKSLSPDMTHVTESDSQDSVRRPSSPSVNLMRRLKGEFRATSPSPTAKTRARPRQRGTQSNCSSRDSSIDNQNRSTRSPKPVASPRTRSKSTCEVKVIKKSSRTTKSVSRPSTPDVTAEKLHNKELSGSSNSLVINHPSPRRYRRPSNYSIPTRIPAPNYHANVTQSDNVTTTQSQSSDSNNNMNDSNNNSRHLCGSTQSVNSGGPMISSTSTFDSMDSLRTV